MKEQKQKTFDLKYTEQELVQIAELLEKDEDLNIFLKVQSGAAKYEQYTSIIQILQKVQKKQKEIDEEDLEE